MKRRRFMTTCGHGALGLTLGAGGVWLLDGTPRQPVPVSLGPLDAMPEGTVRLFPRLDVAVVRRASGIALVSLRCTHLGCQLRLAGQQLVCPCHGGRFDLDGAVQGGPPPRPLPWLEGQVSRSGEVLLYPGRIDGERELIPL